MERLTADAAVLTDKVHSLKDSADAALKAWREARDMLEETNRVLAAYNRIRSPRRRVRL